MKNTQVFGGAGVRRGDVTAMARHLSTLLRAGLPLVRGLRTLAKQFDTGKMAEIVSDLAERVGSGDSLSAAMAASPKVFDPLTVSVIRAGEVGATLPKTLTRLADDLETKEDLRRTVIGAMTYPGIVISMSTIVVAFVLLYIVPIFEEIYTKSGATLPMITRLLLFVSETSLMLWWVPPLLVVGVLFGRKPLMNNKKFRAWWDNLALRLPVLGKLRNKAMAARVLNAFSALVGSGVSVVDSLRLIGDLASNVVVQDAVEEIRQHVSRGGRMSVPMSRYGDMFSPMTVQMIAVGEETGTLPAAAAESAELLLKDVENRVRVLTSLLQPILTLGLGIVVGTIAIAVYLPMFDLMTKVSE